MKGHKYCKCGEYTPARGKTCKHCGYEFQEGDKFEPPRVFTPDEQLQYDYCVKMRKRPNETLILIPAGDCPANMGDFDCVEDWIEYVLSVGRSNNKLYFTDAIKYFALKQLGGVCKQYREVSVEIERYLND